MFNPFELAHLLHYDVFHESNFIRYANFISIAALFIFFFFVVSIFCCSSLTLEVIRALDTMLTNCREFAIYKFIIYNSNLVC